jgi:lysophospholipase L1-like esterase
MTMKSARLLGVTRLGTMVLLGLTGCGGAGAGGAGTGGAGTGGATGATGGATGGTNGGGGVGSGGAGTLGSGGTGMPTTDGGADANDGEGAIGSGGASGSGGAAAGSGGASGTGGGSAAAGGRAMGSGGATAGTSGAAGRGGVTGSGGAATGGAAGAVGPAPTTATRMMCTGSDPIACHFGGQPGNYDVTVILGGTAAARTGVQAETSRTMLDVAATGAGQTQRFTFTVNVRQPEGQPIQAVSAGTPGLDVYFAGDGGVPPQLQSIGYAAAKSPFMIYLAGDSTVCDQTDTDYGGWGQSLPRFFDYPVSIANYADSGESSGSFLGSASLFGAILSRLQANDYVLIQFGHNDKTTTMTAFHDNLTRMVTMVKSKGAFPVLVTPTARAQYDSTTKMLTPQHINDVMVNLPMVIKQVGSEQSVPVLDLTTRTTTWLNQLGPNGWQPYHALGTDLTHTNPAGAAVIASFVRDLIQQAQLTALTSRMR